VLATRGVVAVSTTVAADDSYMPVNAAAVLDLEFNVPRAILQVHEGVVVLIADSLGKVDRQSARPQILFEICTHS
jgi:hypothetical protein